MFLSDRYCDSFYDSFVTVGEIYRLIFSPQLFTTQSQLLRTIKKTALENTVGKGENAGNQHFLLLPQYFLLYQREISLFKQLLICRLQMLSIWSCLKICRFGKGLNVFSRRLRFQTSPNWDQINRRRPNHAFPYHKVLTLPQTTKLLD